MSDSSRRNSSQGAAVNEIQPIVTAHQPSLARFFGRLPAGEITFFKEDVREPAVIAAMVRDRHGSRYVAVDLDDEVVGYVAVLPRLGWSAHVGEVHLAVDPAARRRGLGRELARQALVAAVEAGLRKLIVEVVADQAPAVAMFQALGFEGEALLVDHIRTPDGVFHDLMVLAHHVDESWSELSTTGVEDALS